MNFKMEIEKKVFHSTQIHVTIKYNGIIESLNQNIPSKDMKVSTMKYRSTHLSTCKKFPNLKWTLKQKGHDSI